MAKEKEKKQKSRFGAFVGGGFLGFNLCLFLIVGTLVFAYFKVSPNWINKTFKTDIAVSDELGDKTLSDVVKTVSGILKNSDTYTLSNLKSDFGIEVKDELFGIAISDLKQTPIKDLGKAVEEKFANISAQEIKNVPGMNLQENMGKILSKTNTYYYNNDNLYKNFDGTEYSNAVTFKFELNENKNGVTVKGQEFDIDGNIVKIDLWHLPLASGLSDFTSNMGENITLYDLENDFGVKLPSFFNFTDAEKMETTVNELEGAIKGLYLADVLGYTIDGETVKDSSGVPVTGVIASLAKLKIEGLTTGINNLTLENVFTETELSSGAMSLIPSTTKLTDIASVLNNKFATLKLDEIVSSKIITLSVPEQQIYNGKKEMYVKGTSKKVKDLLLQEIIILALNDIETSETPA